jgi:hypothetical protein
MPAKKKAAKKAAQRKPTNSHAEPAKKIARQASLPGMEDRKITMLNNAALSYAEIRDERMAWTKKEVDAKKKVSDLMHAHKKTHYKWANILIDLVPEGEKVKVTVAPVGTEVEDDTEVTVTTSASESTEEAEEVEEGEEVELDEEENEPGESDTAEGY